MFEIVDWALRRWITAAAVTVGAALAMGVPTGIVRTSWYHRMTPVLWWNYLEWVASAMLIGLLAATYVARQPGQTAVPMAGGLLSTLAIGCPICNKVAVAALGLTGALKIWAPIQPWLGIASLAMLVYALRRRLVGERACPVPRRA